jgi:hypothetical protein
MNSIRASAQLSAGSAERPPKQPRKSKSGNLQSGPNKQAVDKLIKQNIRKNQTKLEEDLLKKQHEEERKLQRKNELSQRNQEVRQLNASKVIANTKQGHDSMLSPVNTSNLLTT